MLYSAVPLAAGTAPQLCPEHSSLARRAEARQPLRHAGHIYLAQRRSIGIAGEELAVEEDCLYATDWRLLRIVLHDFDSGQDVSLIADRTGCDSMSLQAPPQVV